MGEKRFDGCAAQVAFWLGMQVQRTGRVPTAMQIKNRWHCSRATAYRYQAFAEAFGTTPMSAPSRRRSA